MKRLELIKGLSYSMRGFSCDKGKPFDVEDDKAEQLMKTGRFKELEALAEQDNIVDDANDENVTPLADDQTPHSADDEELTAKKVKGMKVAELIALAEQKNISLEGCNKHDEYVERINGQLGLVDFSQFGLE